MRDFRGYLVCTKEPMLTIALLIESARYCVGIVVTNLVTFTYFSRLCEL